MDTTNQPQAAAHDRRRSAPTSFRERFFKSVAPVIYGLGAAIVIMGALFKLMNWRGASAMLVGGLSAEALLFVLSIFEPSKKELDWGLVYPELEGNQTERTSASPRGQMASVLGDETVQQATQAYAQQMELLTKTVVQLNEACATEATQVRQRLKDTGTTTTQVEEALAAMQAANQSVSRFKTEMEALHQKVAQLNTIYAKTLASFGAQ